MQELRPVNVGGRSLRHAVGDAPSVLVLDLQILVGLLRLVA